MEKNINVAFSRQFQLTKLPPIDLYLIFEKSSWKIKLDELDFLFISPLNFAGYTESKNQVWSKKLKLSLFDLIFQKSSADH